MKTPIRIITIALCALPLICKAQLSLTLTNYSQNFDSLPTSGSVDPNTVITGWFVGTGTGALTSGQAAASTGVGTTVNNFNYGIAGVSNLTDRALGSLAGSVTQRDTEFRFVNNLGVTISSLTLSYTGEQWRVGGSLAVNNVLQLQYSYDGTNFTAIGPAFDFNTPLDSAASGGALDGNASTNRVTGIGGVFTLPLLLTNGGTFYLRWADADNTSSDNGVALDDFTMTVATNLPPPYYPLTAPTYSQDFDSLPTAGIVEAQTSLTGWFVGTGTGALIAGTATASSGSAASGNYNFGVAGVSNLTDRALGSLAASSTQRDAEFRFVNNIGSTITALAISYAGEQWRVGGASSVNNTLQLQYSYDGTNFSGLGPAFDFNTPLDSSAGSALDGNASTNRVPGIGGTFTLPTPLTNGATFYLRWADADDASLDHAIALDDFTLTASLFAAPTSLYWDTNGAAPGIGGAGIWDTTTSNWSGLADGTGSPQTFAPANEAVFGGTAGNVTIAGGGVTAAALKFEASGYTISGDTLTLAGLGNVNTTGASTTINAPISGSAGLTKTGSGLLTLSGANNFTGLVTINGGSLSFGSEDGLGDADNDIVLGGGSLNPSATLTIVATRDLTGSGAMKIPAGNKLTTLGNVNLASLELISDDIGHSIGVTLALDGTSNTLGGITFSDPATIEAPNSLTLTGNVTVASGVANTCSLTGNVAVSSAAHTFHVIDTPEDIDFLLQGNLSGSGRITKTGAGTLQLAGSNTNFPGGFRLGEAGATPKAGGRLLIRARTALGSFDPQLFFNDGTLETETALTGTNAITTGVSIGAGQLGSATFAGADMEFNGTSSFFKASGAPSAYTNRMTVNNNLTFSGYFDDSTGTGTSVGVHIDGTGSMTLASTIASHSIDLPITLNGPTLVVNGTLYSPSITVETGTLAGGGEIVSDVTIKGTLSPGSSIDYIVFQRNLTLAGIALMELNRTNGINATSDRISVSQTLILGGSLVVTNIGPALLSGDTFDLFFAVTVSNSFSTVTLPALSPGLRWNTNTLATNGVIKVESLPLPTIQPVSVAGTNLVLLLDTQSGSSYILQSATNLLNTNTVWTDVLTNSGTGTMITNTPPIDPAIGQEFFRYRVE